MSAQSVIPRVVTVATGRFAPGHLGELTRIVPFEMLDAALESTRATQVRGVAVAGGGVSAAGGLFVP
ncbi:Thiolase N-terminal domain-containing protein [Nocardia ninae]|uniref:Uncharacterized protein n=1 Tax=Nocardia ninae NBRC 108245 TaxID=1210091 RepID=A0A511MHM8_9NOCA|nr:hypothetical protein NN4_44700 [Nocardia ninae NBRC 108245]